MEPMTGTTYSRTSGTALLPGTWAYIRARGDIPDAEKLAADERYSYDTASGQDRADFAAAALTVLLRPPAFLKFALATGADRVENYPGLVPETQGKPANGHLGNLPHLQACSALGISLDALKTELGKFSGLVTVMSLPVGSVIYRTVGLMADGAKYGSVTNRLLGGYWEPECPNNYPDEAAWRAATAVKAEWNGDHGHIEVTLKRPLVALFGVVGMQKVDRNDDVVLPGGGMQYFIPKLSEYDLNEPMAGVPIIQLIKPTLFGTKDPA